MLAFLKNLLSIFAPKKHNSSCEITNERWCTVSKENNSHKTEYKNESAVFSICEYTSDNNSLTFSDLSAKWLSHKKRNVKESSYAFYYRTVKVTLDPLFGEKVLSVLSGEEINDIFLSLINDKRENGKCLSPSTISNITRIFRNIWLYGQKNNFPCEEFELIKDRRPNQHIRHVMTSDEVMNIVNIFLEHRTLTSLGILFVLFTGVRIGELCGIKWKDISLNERNSFVIITTTVQRIIETDETADKKTKVIIDQPKTEKSKRSIPIVDFLRFYMQGFQNEPDTYFLTGTTLCTEPHTFYMRYKTFLKKYGLGNYTFHELRHSFSTFCVDKKMDIKSLSEILGHSTVKTTMDFYVHPSYKSKKNQLEKLVPPNLSCN